MRKNRKKISLRLRRSNKPILAAAMAALLLFTAGCAGSQAPKEAESFIEEVDDIARNAVNNANGADAAKAASAFDPRDLFEPMLPVEDNAVIFNDGDAAAGKSDVAGADAAGGKSDSVDEKNAASGTADGSGAVVGSNAPAVQEDKLEVLFLGDSQFAAQRGTGTEIPALFEKYVDWTGCRVYNLGIAGSCFCLKYEQYLDQPEDWNSTCFYAMAQILAGKIDPSYLGVDHPEVLETLKTIDPKRLDYIVINYGVNDYLRSSIILNEDNPDLPDSVVGAYTRGLLLLREACPNATFINCTPLYSYFYDRDGAMIGDGISLPNGQGKTLSDYVSCVEVNFDTVDRSYVLNMFNGDYMDLDMYSVGDYLSDGVHLTARGRKVFATVLKGFIGRREGIDPDSYGVVKIKDF